MNYSFRPASKTEAKPLIGIYSESGCGKTKSSLLLAKGFAGDMSTVGMIETESGRGEAYADDPEVGGYRVLPIRGDFSPVNYGKAIQAAEQANLKVLIIDSASHEWESAGGVLSMAADNQAAGKKGPLVWQQPKILHQREFMLRLLATPIPLVIVCMRAKYPMKEVVNNGKKEWARSPDLEPKQSDDILFEMFVHGWIDQQHNFHGTKYTVDALRKVFVSGQPITEESGRLLAAWASGAPKTAAPQPPAASPDPSPHSGPASAEAAAPDDGLISVEQIREIESLAEMKGCKARLTAKLIASKIKSVDQIPVAKFDAIIGWLDGLRVQQ